MRNGRLLKILVVVLLVCAGGASAAAAAAGPGRAHRSRRSAARGPAQTRLIPLTAAIPLKARNGTTTIALPSGGVPRRASIRAAFVQVQLSGRGAVTLGEPGAATATISNPSPTAIAVGSGVAAAPGGRLPVRVSGRLRTVRAYVVALFVSAKRGDTLHQAIGDGAATVPALRIGAGRTRTLALPLDGPNGTRAVLATLTGSLPRHAVLSAGAVPLMGGGNAQGITAMLPVSGGRVRLRVAGAGRASVAIQLLAYVAPDQARSVGAPIELLSRPSRTSARGETTVAGRHGLPTASSDAPPTGALLSIHVVPGPGHASVAPLPLSTNDGRILSAAQAVPYVSAGPGQGASAVVLAPLSSTGALSLRGNSARVHVELLGASAGDIRIPAGTVVLDGADLSRLLAATPNGLVFQGTPAALAAIRPGDIVASGVTAKAPMGLLRKVTAVSHSSGDLVLTTVQASIRDVLTQGTIQVQRTLTPSQMASFQPAARGARLRRPYDDGNGSLGFQFNNPLTPGNTSSGSASVSGGINLSPSVNFTASASLFPPSFSAQFTAGLQEGFDAQLQAEASTGNELSLEWSQRLGRTLFSPIAVPIGPVPILLWPDLEIDLGVSGNLGASLDASISQSRSVTYGLGYSTSGGFYTIDQVSPNQVTHTLHLTGDAALTLSNTIGANLLIDGAAGPGLSVGPYIEWSADTSQNPWWKLSAGIEASVNFSVPVVNLSDSYTFATLGGVLATSNGPFETVTISPKSATVHRGATQQFGAATSTLVPGLSWSTDGGTVGPTGLYTAPMTAGTYHVTATSTDEPAASDTATVTVPPDPPAAPTGVSAVPAPSGATVSWSPPSDDGGVPIASYTVTASPGGAQATSNGSATSATFNNLNSGQNYTFTVTATNSAGLTGPASSASPAMRAGNPAYAEAEPSSLTFPNTSTGHTSTPQTVTVLAPNGQSTTIGAITRTGDTPDQFQIENDQCSNQTVPANGSCTFQVVYAPSNCCSADAVVQIPTSTDGNLTVAVSYQESYPGALTGVSMPDDLHAWAVGDPYQNGTQTQPGTVISTSDGGQTWQKEDLSASNGGQQGATETMSGASFLDSQHGWAVGRDCIFYRCFGSFVVISTDGGQSWSSGGSLPMDQVGGVKFLNTTHGFVVGSGTVNSTITPMLAVTTDGGQNWSQASTPAPAGASSFDTIAFAPDGLHGVVSGTGYDQATSQNENFALYTSDGGQTWQLASIAGASYTPSFLSPTSGNGTDWWAVAGTQLFKSNDDGASWTSVSTPALTNGTSAVFTDASHGWVADAPAVSGTTPPPPEFVWYTSDGGTTWRKTEVAPVNQNCSGPGASWETYPVLPYIAAADASHAVLAGAMYTNNSGTVGQNVGAVETSTDADQNWSTPPCW